MELEYYLDKEHKNVFAYDAKTEFFVRFVKSAGRWESCNFSFMAFIHDVDYTELTEEKTKTHTGGNLPEKEYIQYVNMLKNNLKGV